MRGQGAYFWCMFDYLFGETDTFDLNYYIFLINQQPTSKKLQLFGFLPFSHVQIAFIELLPCNLQKVFFCEISLQLRYQISSAPSVIDPFFWRLSSSYFPFVLLWLFSVFIQQAGTSNWKYSHTPLETFQLLISFTDEDFP